MRRIVLLVTVALVITAMLVFAGPAFAQAGCKAFGLFVASNAPHSGAPAFTPVNDEVLFLKALNC